jgi:hypothetical protein
MLEEGQPGRPGPKTESAEKNYFFAYTPPSVAEEVETLEALRRQLEAGADFCLRQSWGVLCQQLSPGGEMRTGGCWEFCWGGWTGGCLRVHRGERKLQPGHEQHDI